MEYLILILAIIVVAQAYVIHESDDIQYVQAIKERMDKQDKLIKEMDDTLNCTNYQLDKSHEALGILCKSLDYAVFYAKNYCAIVTEVKRNDPVITANFKKIEENLNQMGDAAKSIEKKFLSDEIIEKYDQMYKGDLYFSEKDNEGHAED